jgi:5-methylcytosine-specific restriction endonuclease McrA
VAQARRELDSYLCQGCLKNDRLTTSNLVVDIIPINVRADWRLEIGNTQVLCNACHSIKTASDIRSYGGQAAVTRDQVANRRIAMQITAPTRDDE